MRSYQSTQPSVQSNGDLSFTYSDSDDYSETLPESMPLTSNDHGKGRHHLLDALPRRCGPSVVRVLFGIAVSLAIASTLALASGVIESSEWLEQYWELGVGGMRAQSLANASIFRRKVSTFDPNLMLGHSREKSTDSSLLQDGCETTVLLIRHCEKGSLKHHCNYNGYERSVYLSTLFGHKPGYRWPAPSRIFALKAKGRKHGKDNYREVETVQSIANQCKVKVDESYKASHTKKLAKHITKSILSGELCGKLTLISWKHSDLPRLAQHLGCGPLEGCPRDYKGKEFDQVWQIKYAYRSFHHQKRHHKPTVTRKHWDVFGTVQRENFDPLAFSKVMGDYPEDGTPTGARWAEYANLKQLYG